MAEVNHSGAGQALRLTLRVQSPWSAPRRSTHSFPVLGPEDDPKSGRIQLGSDPSADVAIEDRSVAPFHASIQRDGDEFVVKDRGTPGGTFVNGTRCKEPTRLMQGSRIVIGQTTVSVTEICPLDAERHEPPAYHAPEQPRALGRDALVRGLGDAAREWRDRGRPRRRLMRPRQVAEAQRLLGPLRDVQQLDPIVAEFVASSLSNARTVLNTRWLLGGVLLGTVLAIRVWLAPEGSSDRADEAPMGREIEGDARDDGTEEPRRAPACIPLDHEVEEGETWEQIASQHAVPADLIKRQNSLNGGKPPPPGSTLRICSYGVSAAPRQFWHTVGPRDTWETIARRYNVPVERLRRKNKDLGEVLKPGDLVVFTSTHGAVDGIKPPAEFIVPPEIDARSIGTTNAGKLVNGAQLPESTLYHIRCKTTSFATGYTIEAIIGGARLLRAEYGGELIIGDISREDGGPFGDHRSHQSGRDADIWLPILGGKYRRSRDPNDGCWHCWTEFCRPLSNEVDWDATWRMIKSLARIGTDDYPERSPVKEIFLDRTLHGHLRAAIARDGFRRGDINRFVQRREGAPALVQHGSRHVQHIHVRFRCPPGDAECRD